VVLLRCAHFASKQQQTKGKQMITTQQPIKAVNPFQWIVEIFNDYTRSPKSDLPFDYLVAVCGRMDSPGPRDERFEYIRDVGMPNIEKVLRLQPIGAGPHFFIFPDRWMVPGEAMEFLSKLKRNPDAKKFKRVYVVTHQPYLVGDCRREQVRIVRKES
jgi:hypothetical protein